MDPRVKPEDDECKVASRSSPTLRHQRHRALERLGQRIAKDRDRTRQPAGRGAVQEPAADLRLEAGAVDHLDRIAPLAARQRAGRNDADAVATSDQRHSEIGALRLYANMEG